MMHTIKFALTLAFIGAINSVNFGQRQVTGRVIDLETKKPIKDAKIAIEGTSIETSTNILGFFQVSIDSAKSLIIESPDYELSRVQIPEGNGFLVGLSRNKKLPRIDSISSIREEPASFPGGMQKFYKYIYDNLKFPKDAKSKGISGRVMIEFAVDVDGSIPPESIKIINSLLKSCDDETIRLITNSPKWNPGMRKDQPVRQRMILPIVFKWPGW